MKFLGIEYGRGCLRHAIPGGPGCGPGAIREMFPNDGWVMVQADPFDADFCARDRFGENFEIQKKIYAATDELCASGDMRHILIGGDHSVNFGHFAACADNTPGDLCLVYIDAHFDIHNPESARAQASGAPHGTNVRALLGDGDARWLSLLKKRPALRPENLFYLGSRSFEPAEEEFIAASGIFSMQAENLRTRKDCADAVNDIRARIEGRPFVLSFDFDAIDPNAFSDVLVPAPSGLQPDAARFFINEFKDALSFEFVEYSPSGDPKSAAIVKELIEITMGA
jgi:arginase family enzyme